MLCQRFVADLIAIKVCWLCGRWKSTVVDVMITCIGWLADVSAIVADGIATLVDGKCYCHCGRWNSQIGWNDFDYGRCYCLCGRWNASWVNYFIYYFLFYFILSSEILNRTSSHMWILNEWKRSMNSTLELYMYQKEACINQLR